MPACVVSALCASFAPASLAETPPAAGKASPDALQSTADAVAADLIANIGPKAKSTQGGRLKIAVRPFQADEVANLPTAEQLNGEVEAALQRQGAGAVEIMTRAQLGNIWAEIQEFSGNDPDERFRGLTRDAGADVLVLGKMQPATGGYSVEYRAIDVRAASTGQALAFTREPRLLPAALAAPVAEPLDQAMFRASRDLARQLVAVTKLTSDAITITHSGDRSDMAETLLDQLENRLREQIGPARRRAAAGPQAYTGEAPPDPGPTEIVISARPRERAHWVEVRFEAQAKDRGRPTSTTVTIQKSDLADLLPLDRNRPFQASAEAVVTGALDLDAASRAARALARARVIAQKTDPLMDDTPVMVNGLTDGAIAMQALSGGLTLNEQWQMDKLDGGKRVRATLTATVKPVGGPTAPRITAVISTPVVQTEAPFKLTLTSNAPAYVGVFDWTSDDKVLRAYPYAGHKPVVLAAGTPLTLPRPDEDPLTSDLRPKVAADFEALIVVASSQKLNYDKIAQEAGATLDESLAREVPIADVFAALAALPGDISVSIVPYQVVAKP
jgi:hypothetical protein